MLRNEDITMMINILAAFVLGGIVGWERERKNRAAGLRTHILVAAGSACFTSVSIYGFEAFGANRDPARLAAQIVTGIGFLGAGVIFRTDTGVKGLTTAASVWMVAAIGVLAGVGLYAVATFATLLTWITLRWLVNVESAIERRENERRAALKRVKETEPEP